MALSNHDQARIREYLLGKLDEAEQEQIEERLMVEDELFQELEASKDELVEEYCAGELDQAERRWFEEHFLASREGQERRAFVLAMDCLQKPRPATIGETNRERDIKRVTPFQRFKALFKSQQWAMATVAAVVLVVGMVFLVTRLRSRGEGQTFAATITSHDLTRGEQAPLPTRINLPPNTSVLRLRLQFTKPAAAGTRYQAELDDRVNRKPIDIVESDPESVTVALPAAMIPRGQYAVKLSIVTVDGNEQQRSYRFTIE